LPTILPQLTEQQAQETAAITSISDQGLDVANWLKPPYRAPHTASAAALVGGGSNPSPYLTHTINIHLKTILCAIKNLGVALHLEKRGVAIFAKAFMSIPAQQAAKTTRPLMPAAAPDVLVTRSLPNKG